MHQEPQTEEEEYIAQLPNWEKRALEIAKEDLKSSFDLQKSNGFIAWKKQKQEKSTN